MILSNAGIVTDRTKEVGGDLRRDAGVLLYQVPGTLYPDQHHDIMILTGWWSATLNWEMLYMVVDKLGSLLGNNKSTIPVQIRILENNCSM